MSSVIEKANDFRRDAKLFWISCFMLFFEILMIRWLSAEIRIFAYFQNLVLLFASGFIIINLMVDFAYGWMDPRIRYT